MTYYILLILVLLICVYSSYKLFDDFFSVSFLASFTYLVSVVVAFISRLIGSWNNLDIGFESFYIISIGVYSIILGEFTISKILDNKKIVKINTNYNNKIITQILMFLFATLTLFVVYYKMAEQTGIYFDIPKLIDSYHSGTVLYNNSKRAMTIGTIAVQMYRISVMEAFYSIFMICSNILKKRNLKNYLGYIFIVLTVTIISIMYAGRTTAISFVIAGLFDISFLTGITKFQKINKKAYTCIFAMLIIGAISFYAIMPIIGRKQPANLAKYVSFYVGSPVPALQYTIDNNTIQESTHFGQRTFKGPQRFLDKFGLIDYYSSYQDKWVEFPGRLYTNVFTGMSDYYYDFGIAGVIMIEYFTGLLFSFIYLLVKRSKDIFIPVYFSTLAFYLFNHFRANVVFNSIISIDGILSLIYLFIGISVAYYIDSILEKRATNIN